MNVRASALLAGVCVLIIACNGKNGRTLVALEGDGYADLAVPELELEVQYGYVPADGRVLVLY